MLMKHILRQKSLFGLKVLNSNHSTIAAYVLLTLSILTKPFLGMEHKTEFIAASLFILISNASVMILILNSIQQRPRNNFYPWLFYNFPLWIYFSLILNQLFEEIKAIMELNILLFY